MPNEETPPATPPVQPATPPAKPPGQGAAPPKNGKGKHHKGNGKQGGGGVIKIPQAAFKERVRRDAVSLVRQTLGVSLEEAEKIVKAGGVKTPQGANSDQAANATANEALRKASEENARLRKQLEGHSKKNTDWERKYKKDTQKLRDKATETELRFKATQAGIVDTDYAVSLFARAVAAQKATDADKFFADLKGTHAHLFVQPTVVTPPAPPVVVPANTAPPESQQPGGKTPTPSNPTGGGGQENVDDLPPHEFAARTRARYGFTPGA